MEEWRNIEGFDTYEISNFGNIRNKKTNRVLKNRIGKYGYYICCIMYNKEKKYKLIHRLIAQAFIPNPENKECIDHIDGNPLNNSIENLRWVSRQENQWNRNSKGYSKNGEKFQAKIINNEGKFIHLGMFNTEEEARQAYLTKAIELRGEGFVRK